MRMKHSCRAFLAAWVVSGGIAAPAAGQTAPDAAARAEVVSVVEKLFDGMRARDTVAIRSVFDPSARLVNASGRGGGVSVTTVDQFVISIGRAPDGVELIERIYAPEVRIDSNLASVWTFYTFHRGEQFSHCGIDAIQLLRTAGAWKIVHIADTRRTERCEPPG